MSFDRLANISNMSCFLLVVESVGNPTWLTVIIAVLTGPAVVKGYEYLTAKRKIDSDSKTNQEVHELKLDLQELRTAVSMLVTVIENQFTDRPELQSAVHKVKEQLPDEKNKTNSTGNQ